MTPELIVPIVVALIVSIVAPRVLASSVNKRADAMAALAADERRREKEAEAEERRKEKQQDWDRQDQVAAKAEAAAAALVAANQVVADAALAATTATTAKLDDLSTAVGDVATETAETHTIVNSHYTAQMQDTLDAEKVSLALMRRLAGEEDSELIAATEAKIAKLERDLVDRRAAEQEAKTRAGAGL